MITDFKKQIIQNKFHKNCFACGSNAGIGLGLKFYKQEDGVVIGNFFADPKYEGYSGVIHGGIIATLLDSAMTNCLLMKDIPALTGRLSIRYSVAIKTGAMIRLEAKIMEESRRIFTLKGKAYVEGKEAASAEATFYRNTKRMINQEKKK